MLIKVTKKIRIGHDSRTFIIAEAGINHNGDLDAAFRLVKEAKLAGADAIKFQTYDTDKRVAKSNPVYEILKKCELTQDQQARIKNYAEDLDIVFFSTPFDEDSINFLQSINIPMLKIASFDIVNKKLILAAAATGLPLIISRGMASQGEIDEAVEICKAHSVEFSLLHCVSAYPAPKESVNLRIINTLQKKYSCPIGYSDHTLDIDASVYAVAAGACIIEKHFTLDKNMDGPDQKMSVDPIELKLLVSKIRELEIMLGEGEIKPLEVEDGAKIFRRPTN
jgi:N,N'-diacetyllegionaminate synthase